MRSPGATGTPTGIMSWGPRRWHPNTQRNAMSSEQALPRQLTDELDLARTRRQFFRDCAVGLGSLALASLLRRDAPAAEGPRRAAGPLAPRQPHFPARARSVIYLFMAGGPSQLELFE